MAEKGDTGMYRRFLRKETCLYVLLIVAAAARIYYCLENPPPKLSHDEIGYHQMALRFLEKGELGYYSDEPNAFVTPGYPIFLAGIYALAKPLDWEPLVTVRVVQAMLSTGIVYLVFKIAASGTGFWGGMMAAVLAAIYPPSFMAGSRVLTETVYSFLLLCYVLTLISAFRTKRMKEHLYSGLVLGLTVLVRPAIAPFLPVPYMVAFIRNRQIGFLKAFAGAMIVFTLVMGPWWIRNYMVFDKFIPLATQTGNPLLRGTDPYDPYDKIGPSIVANVPEKEMTKTAMTRIKSGFRENPFYWLKWFTIGKFNMLWEKPWGSINFFTRNLHFYVFFIMGWLGTLVSLWDKNLRWASLLIMVMTLTQLAFIPIERYMYPLTPLMAVMSVSLLRKIVQRDLT